MEYTIKAFPTEYRGRTYRSRLEARWAAFFDLLGWDVEYEPMDLGAWSPDFLIRSPEGAEVLVEVKPITSFEKDIAAKMARATHEVRSEASLLLVGLAPQTLNSGLVLGWYGSPEDGRPSASWSQAFVYWTPLADKPGMRADILWADAFDGTEHYHTALGFDYVLPDQRQFYGVHAKALWARASSIVQWRRGE